MVAYAPEAEQQRQVGGGEDEEDGRIVLGADQADQGRAEDRADAEVCVEDVEHGGRAMAEADGEQLVEPVVDAAETHPGEQGRGQGERPVRRQREARRTDAHQEIRGAEDLPVAEPPVQPVEEEDPRDPADEVGAQPQSGRRGREPELLAEGGDRGTVQRLEHTDEDEADAGGDDGRRAEHGLVRGHLDMIRDARDRLRGRRACHVVTHAGLQWTAHAPVGDEPARTPAAALREP